ncbi:MAG: hypothetical protein ACXWIU_06130, partial [Limisphaerales bacterium]
YGKLLKNVFERERLSNYSAAFAWRLLARTVRRALPCKIRVLRFALWAETAILWAIISRQKLSRGTTSPG